MRKLIDPERLGAIESGLSQMLVAVARPRPLALIQRALAVLLTLWALNSLAQLLWMLWPAADSHVLSGAIVNPASFGRSGSTSREIIRIDDAMGLGLFGSPDQAVEVEAVAAATGAASPRDGIEEGASETRLALKLTGIVASTEDGLGTAVIAAKNVESTYAVGDSLPVQGDVTLAKIMSTQVVLDNNGTYELLKLFEDSALGQLAASNPSRPVSVAPSPAKASSVGPAPQLVPSSAVAGEMRAQLYEDPQSLAEVVQVAAVRDDSGLRGYRVSPGRNAAQFRALGFQPGDVVTAVNGLPLSDPANTVRLYQMMREATEATFEIERNGGNTSLSVSLGAQP
ncbi:MAG: type II secretion system protein GspC [Halieaceae bacterium]|nr:type II secretion system protein GspC [Halieaceae bacterium]